MMKWAEVKSVTPVPWLIKFADGSEIVAEYAFCCVGESGDLTMGSAYTGGVFTMPGRRTDRSIARGQWASFQRVNE